MKILYIGNPFYSQDPIFKYNPGIPLPLFRQMSNINDLPVDLEVAFTLDEVNQKMWKNNDPDIVFLESPTWIEFAHELGFLNDSSALIVAFHADIWQKEHWFDILKVDLHIGLCGSVTKMISKEFRGNNYYFMPHYIDVHPSDRERDIDVLLWGWMGSEYTFRNFVWSELESLKVSGVAVEEQPRLFTYTIELNEKRYKYARLCTRVMDSLWYGEKLYELLNRAKICPTGPVQVYQGRIAVGKYFENMACGAVVMSCPVDDSDRLGFVDGSTIFYTCEERFIEDLAYLLEHPAKIGDMSLAAMDMIPRWHSPSIRACQLYFRLKRLCHEKRRSG